MSNTTNTRDSISSGNPNTEKRAENTTRRKLRVFGYPLKNCLERLIYFLNRNKDYQVHREVKSSKSMLIKTWNPNLLHGCDFSLF